MKKTLVLTIGLFLTISVWAQEFRSEVASTLRASVMAEAAWAMKQQPVTVTATHSDRSAGGRHDFFSEADYFWPNPASPDSPYINKDGQSNPNNFVAHRLAMIRLSKVVGALGSAWVLTHDDKYVRQALDHCRAWFVDTATMMDPDLRYGQAIKGRVTGRSYGIIDTIQLIEVVMGLEAMERSKAMDAALLEKIKTWFGRYLHWLTTHPYGVTEMNAPNNHSTCWAMQVAAFARFTGNHTLMDFCKTRYKTVLLPRQMAPDGSFPLEIRRTKPYGYSLFNLDAMAAICQLLSTPGDDLWHYQADSGKSIQKGIGYLYPYIADKSKWPYPHDIMIWDQWPVAQPALLFGAVAYGNKDWLDTWRRLDHDPQNAEVIRNLPVRHPLIWMRQMPVSPVDVPKVIAAAERQTEVMLDSVKAIREAYGTGKDGAPGDAIEPGDGKTPFSPRTIGDGRLKLVASRDWTSGYFPGVLWMLYEYTGKPEWKRDAERFTAPEERESVNGTSHDVGLKIFSSFGAGYRITRDTAYRRVIVTAARTLATRFNPRMGVIRSWDHHRELWQYPVIIDNMMNLELLFEATRITGDSSFYRIAVSHANTTMKNHFRADYSSFHVVDYDTVTGRVRRRMTWQGYADSSAWARGQAWGLYGYTVCYRYTHDPAYLRQAEHIAAFILHHPRLPADMVPYWDFDAPGIPNEPRDASAAAVIASGLYELSGYSANSPAYRKAADHILASLTDHYRAPVGEDKGFILLHSTGTKPTDLEVDEPLSYADYYYIEALLRSTWVPGTWSVRSLAQPLMIDLRKGDTLTRDERMAWWREARFGLFIHWGVYAVLGGEYDGRQINKAGEWIMNRGKIPVAEYRKVARQFNPVKYDPDAWVKMAKDAGMKYIVITAKHHDGFALFGSKASKWNAVDATPYGKDLLKPLAAACKKYGIRLGFYYSQAQDWNNPGGAVSRKLTSEGWPNPDSAAIDAYTAAHNGHWDPAQTTDSMGGYIDKVAVPQVRELLTHYGDVAVLWWDTPTGMTDEYAEKLHKLLALQPAIITNDRLKRPDFPGDYKTPEQKIPKPGELDGDWETCMTMNGTWGFKGSDHNWKTPATLIHNLVDIASKGGNYLLNVGPTRRGRSRSPASTRSR